ncbi:hypothetical protein [Streptomyces sp. 4R-3d]|uniref:hypothetical protein n=1 Tax=Streptomyces sp. 4R-3d TaxID=2559605 RepID=UPI00107167DD|nr:hypothetical protein [Streptomyces sp. 4R-3d]TFI30171.1 hypothetical protein E4P36_05345 [Streptomyces sp. 4R-3d]
MPIISGVAVAGAITGMVPAFDGLLVQISAPAGTDPGTAPPGGPVVGWAVVDDPDAVGGARLDPVFLAAGRAVTPDQYRAAYGPQFDVQVGRAR